MNKEESNQIILKKIILIFLCISFIVPQAAAVIHEDSIKIYAVTTDGEGLMARLSLQIDPGSGKIWSSVTPLVGTSTQKAEKTAIRAANAFFKDTGKYDYKFSIASDASVVDGPSAGASMALLAVSMLTDKDLPDNVSLTGTVREDGSVGPVGGVFEKAKEASKTGVKLFMIPKGEAIQTVKLDDGIRSVNILEYAPKEWGMKVAEVSTVKEALELAHSDISKLDVNTTASGSVPEFVPESLTLGSDLYKFKKLTTNYINESKEIVGEARNALASSLIEDADVTQSLLEMVGESEYAISRADILNEQNYLYSAANTAFLARTNAIMVKEISANPGLLDEESTSFDLRILELKRELDNFKTNMDEPVPKEGFEWFVSAQQRYIYAKNSVDALMETDVIVVGEEDSRLSKLWDYAFAVAWLDVSKDFYKLALEYKGKVNRTNEFENASEKPLSDTNSIASGMEEIIGREDVQRRLNASITESEYSWFEASYFDAASAKAIIEAEKESEGKSNTELKEMLQEKIRELSTKIANGKSKEGWAKLYLDHSVYYLKAAEYYEKNGADSSAESSLKSGLSLVYLADETFTAAEEVMVYYSDKPIVIENNGMLDMPEGGLNNLTVIGGIIFLIVGLISIGGILLGAMHSIHIKKTKKMEEEISALKKMEKEEDKYLSDIRNYTKKIGDLRKNLKAGDISPQRFSKEANSVVRGIDTLNRQLKRELEASAKSNVGKRKFEARKNSKGKK